jgi:hypothetical protein
MPEAIFPTHPVAVVLSADLQPELGTFCRTLCVTPATILPMNGIGLAVTVEAGDAAAIASGAKIIAGWKGDMRSRVADALNGGDRVPLSFGSELTAALDDLARAHWRATDGTRRAIERDVDEMTRGFVKADSSRVGSTRRLCAATGIPRALASAALQRFRIAKAA